MRKGVWYGQAEKALSSSDISVLELTVLTQCPIKFHYSKEEEGKEDTYTPLIKVLESARSFMSVYGTLPIYALNTHPRHSNSSSTI